MRTLIIIQSHFGTELWGVQTLGLAQAGWGICMGSGFSGLLTCQMANGQTLFVSYCNALVPTTTYRFDIGHCPGGAGPAAAHRPPYRASRRHLCFPE